MNIKIRSEEEQTTTYHRTTANNGYSSIPRELYREYSNAVYDLEKVKIKIENIVGTVKKKKNEKRLHVLIGPGPYTRVLELFLVGPETEYRTEDVTKITGMDSDVVRRVIRDLTTSKVIQKTRKKAGSQHYRYDDKTPQGKATLKLYQTIQK